MAQQRTTRPHGSTQSVSFDDLSLAACYIYDGFQLDAVAPQHAGLVTFLVERTPETERIAQDYVTSGLLVDARRFYDSLGIAKRLVHRAREAGK